jgi:hypothetical protein
MCNAVMMNALQNKDVRAVDASTSCGNSNRVASAPQHLELQSPKDETSEEGSTTDMHADALPVLRSPALRSEPAQSA